MRYGNGYLYSGNRRIEGISGVKTDAYPIHVCRSVRQQEECSIKIKEYVRDDGQLPDQEEFKKLQKEYAIKMEGEEVWVGR